MKGRGARTGDRKLSGDGGGEEPEYCRVADMKRLEIGGVEQKGDLNS